MQPSSTPFPAEGLHLNVSSETYHGDREAVSRSQLAKIVMGTPGDLKHAEDNPTEPTPVMVTGSLADDLFYQGADYINASYLVKPEGFDGRSKDGKKWTKDYQNDARARVTWDQWVCAQGMVKAIYGSGLAREFLGCRPMVYDAPLDTALWQSSHVWRDVESGVLCKCRPDTLLTDRGIVVDLKTTADASPMAWLRQCENYRADLQAAFYLMGCNATRAGSDMFPGDAYDRFVWCVVSRQPPHRVEVYECGQAEIEMARKDLRNALKLYAACWEADSWPNSTGELQQINYRRWALE